jgi:hypothetical protein
MQLSTKNFILAHFGFRLENLFNSAGSLVQAVEYKFGKGKPGV